MLGNLLDLIFALFRYLRMNLEGLWWLLTNSSTFGGLLYDTFSFLPPFSCSFYEFVACSYCSVFSYPLMEVRLL